ncbi:MAG TPA: cardiolipin synthase [Noviherbaspirillum sp.]|nr:cardiolipin synthase [Noviherbaspirillum sp.]
MDRFPFLASLARLRIAQAALLCALAGCATTLPDVTHLRERLSGTPAPTIVTSGGEVPPKRREAMLDALAERVGPTDILAHHVAAEERIAGRPLVAGNKVALLDDGPATMRAMREAIAAASDHVNLETYIFDADEVGHELADLLIEKRRAGVVVNVIYDSVGALDTPREFFERMRAAGIAVLEYNPVNPLYARGRWEVNQRNHRKILVVDGQVAFTGGVNISKVYGKSSLSAGSGEPPPDARDAAWRDTHMRIEGPVVADFQEKFLDAWLRQTGHLPPPANYFPPPRQAGNALVRAIGTTPDRGHHAVYKTYISAFVHADRYIHITTAYFVPDREVLQAITDAARRGVDVKIIFPSFSDVSLVLHAGRSFYDELLAAGVKIYERKGAMLHAKTAVIDGVWSTIGSTNLDMRSFLHNDEINAVILDADFARQMETLFQRDLRDSAEIREEEWKQRGLRVRMREWAVRLFSYWL